MPRCTCQPVPLGCQLKENETNSNECTLSRVPLHIDVTAEANGTLCKGDKLNRWWQTVSDSAYQIFCPTRTAGVGVSMSLHRSNSMTLVPNYGERHVSQFTDYASAFVAAANAHVTAVFNFAPLQDNLLATACVPFALSYLSRM